MDDPRNDPKSRSNPRNLLVLGAGLVTWQLLAVFLLAALASVTGRTLPIWATVTVYFAILVTWTLVWLRATPHR